MVRPGRSLVLSFLIAVQTTLVWASCDTDFKSCDGGGVCLGGVCQQFRPVGAVCESSAACSSNCCIGICGAAYFCEDPEAPVPALSPPKTLQNISPNEPELFVVQHRAARIAFLA
jgi:hypothetical protein